eukprot:TRINITY_DN1831_c0_g1_i1.p1 TRINITY_DN1831_c0_g1~~TRINITY_DN1831_c0_g1_i1.p1  ORF type:complete len:265 (-),score=24.47 TRINITY_DN1831_c0_g1_i1:93-887(-)
MQMMEGLSKRDIFKSQKSDASRDLDLEEERLYVEKFVTNRLIEVSSLQKWEDIKQKAFVQHEESEKDQQQYPLSNNPARQKSLFGLPVLKPTNSVVIISAVIGLLLDTIYTSIMLPIFIAFIQNEDERGWEDFIDLIAGFIFTWDFLLNFHVSYLVKFHGNLIEVTNGKMIFYFYVSQGTFFVDAIMVMTFILQVVAMGMGNTEGSDTLKWILLFFRLLRLLRVARILKEAFMSSMAQSSGMLLCYVRATVVPRGVLVACIMKV